MRGDSPGALPFRVHVELLQSFLACREEVVERIEGVLNAQRRPIQYLQDRPLLSRLLEECFFNRPVVADDQARLRGQLQAAHRASGFRPHVVPGLHNDLVDPAEMLLRGFHFWQKTRWPGRGGRVRYAHTLFNLYLLRCLTLLSMRIWDEGSGAAGHRLAQVQSLLDEVWRGAPADQPVFVRDARWLIPLAQSPTTEDFVAYFEVAERIAAMPTAGDRIAIQQAHVRIGGGHLCSQIRHYCLKDGLAIDEQSVIVRTRTSNALDFALLVQGLVLLLEAYEQAVHDGNGRIRIELAGAIYQGISPDPELFLQRIDLLRPYSMTDYLSATTDRDGLVIPTPLARRHLRLLDEYEALIHGLAQPLLEDCPQRRPVDSACSPYGVIFGTATNLIEDMALKSLQPDAVTRFSLEDVFVDRDPGSEKLAWVSGWRKLPHVSREVQKLYEYPAQFAREIFARVEQALRDRVAAPEAHDGSRVGRLFVQVADSPAPDPEFSSIPELPARYIRSSDPQMAKAGRSVFCDQTRLQSDRQEGHFLVSYETSGGWVAISKDFLTEILAEGRDVRIAGLPAVVAGTLRLMCASLIPSGSA